MNMKKTYNHPYIQITEIKMRSVINLSAPQLMDPGSGAKITADTEGDVMESSARGDDFGDLW